MRILLIGDYSGLHSALKHGLLSCDKVTEVVIVGDGDKFKNFAVDYSIRPKWVMTKLGTFLRKVIHRLLRWDIAELEKGFRMQILLPRLKNFDVVQLINDRPIQTIPFWEERLLKQLFTQNASVFLLSCGIDVRGLKYLLANSNEKSLLTPYFSQPSLKYLYDYVFDYQRESIVKLHQIIEQSCKGIIASDWDYVPANIRHPKYKGLIPHPVVLRESQEVVFRNCTKKVIIFLGVNRGNYHQKGISYFEKALQCIQSLAANKIDVIIVENLPYDEYKQLQQSADIVLDQVFSNDQGYNALEAMARGQVVFTGASEDFLKYYNLSDGEVVINALPDVDYLVERLLFLIENSMVRQEIGKQAKQFVQKHHEAKIIAKKYLNTWGKSNN